jgi:hypothetical protein
MAFRFYVFSRKYLSRPSGPTYGPSGARFSELNQSELSHLLLLGGFAAELFVCFYSFAVLPSASRLALIVL